MAGSCSGIAGTLVAYPLDTVKVRFQVSTQGSLSLLNCVRDIYRFEGFLGFYKGVISPMVGRTPIAATLYSSREYALRELEKLDDLGINQKHAVAGMFAGFSYASIAFLFDQLKVRAQGDDKGKINYRQEMSRMYRTEGLRCFYNGFRGQMLRDVPSFAIYFSVYEAIKRNLAAMNS